MTPKVLIVDDDEAWLRLITAELEEYSDAFSVITAGSGAEAMDILRRNHVSIVVSDLRMPEIDGFELLSQVLNVYPDIPVFIVTAYDKPKTREVVFKSGATGYLKKPFPPEELAEAIIHTLKKKSEGGNLHNVSLETFLQLIEMEQQTCTLRVSDKRRGRGGVLFFKNGELVNARIGNRHGKDAAYEILSWSKVSLSIEHECVIQENVIKSDLQAILLNAMRSKDESKEPDKPSTTGKGEILLEKPAGTQQPDDAGGKVEARPQKAPGDKPGSGRKLPGGAATPLDGLKMSPLEAIRKRIETEIGRRNGIRDIYHDNRWEGLTHQALHIGEIFGFGNLNVVYVEKSVNEQYIIVPGQEITVITVSPDSPRDRIVDILS